MNESSSPELYRKHRPIMFKQVIGQSDAVRMINDFLKRDAVPHCILFSGPSGCGKTTLARILCQKLGCTGADFMEMNCADIRGIENIREIRSRMSLAPFSGTCRVWLIDEAHKLTGDAQNAFLKMLEDTPAHVYFFLATTDPGKLLKTVQTRATEIKLKEISEEDLATIVKNVASDEDVTLDEKVVERIVACCDGSARKALVILSAVIGISNVDEQLAAIASSDFKTQGIDIARALINTKTQWKDMAAILKGIGNDDAESIRYVVLGYASAILLNGSQNARAFAVIQSFRDNFYDGKRYALVAACYEVICGR